jgi:hypothetical protein
MLKVLLAILAVGLWIYSIIDVAGSPRQTRTLPKGLWLLIVIVLPVVGLILWVLFGRPRHPRAFRRRSPRAPDDDPTFLRALDEEAWRRRMRERRGEAEA